MTLGLTLLSSGSTLLRIVSRISSYDSTWKKRGKTHYFDHSKEKKQQLLHELLVGHRSGAVGVDLGHQDLLRGTHVSVTPSK